ncbi:hypothetical protein FF38_01892, partial [Lucilia cuprina]
MPNDTLKKILDPLWPMRNTGRPCLYLTKSLYITLWKLSNQNSFRELSDRFGIGAATAYRSFIKMLKVTEKFKNFLVISSREKGKDSSTSLIS